MRQKTTGGEVFPRWTLDWDRSTTCLITQHIIVHTQKLCGATFPLKSEGSNKRAGWGWSKCDYHNHFKDTAGYHEPRLFQLPTWGGIASFACLSGNPVYLNFSRGEDKCQLRHPFGILNSHKCKWLDNRVNSEGKGGHQICEHPFWGYTSNWCRGPS